MSEEGRSDSGESNTPSDQITVPEFPKGTVVAEAKKDARKEDRVADMSSRDDHDDREQNRTLRVIFSGVVALLVTLWMVAVYALLIAQGRHSLYGHFDLSEKVVLVALGTVTLNIIGLLVLVLRYVFANRA